jgi:putative membrane protein
MSKRWRIIRGLLLLYAALTAYISLSPWFGVLHGPWTTPLLTVLGFSLALAHALMSLGRARALLLLGLTFVVSLAFETAGVLTGLVYGPYHYTDMLGPRFLGLVPLLIPAAWFMMVYPSQVIAERLIGGKIAGGAARAAAVAALAAVVMTSWDLLMDPMMVAMGAWVWESPGAYFGIPLHNYAGWLVTTLAVFGLYRWLESRRPAVPRVSEAETRLAVWSYLITWAGNTSAALQFGLAGPALAGAFSAGLMAFLALF